MSTKFPFKYNKIVALLMLAPLTSVNAAAPFFVENSTLNSQLEFLFNPKNSNSEHSSLATDSNNAIYTAFQDAAATKDAVQVAKYTDDTVTLSEYLSVDATAAVAYTYSQIRVNPLDDSLVLGFIENGVLKIRTSTDGTIWQDASVVPMPAGSTPKIFKMELDSQGKIYLFYTDTSNQAEVLKFDGASWQTLYGPVTTKSTNATTVAADIAINSQDKPYFVYRNGASGATLNRTYVAFPDDTGTWQTLLTTGARGAILYCEIAFDNDDNLHLFHVGSTPATATTDANTNNAGGAVYKLDGSNDADKTWALVGNRNLTFGLADSYDFDAGKVSTPAIDMVFDSNNVAYLAFQQMNNGPTSLSLAKKQMQMAKLENNVWTEIPYDINGVIRAGKDPYKAIHNHIDLTVDSYDRPIVILRSAGVAGAGHNAWGYAQRLNLSPADPSATIPFSINEGNVIAGNLVVGKLTASDDDSDAITLTLSGADAGLFTIDQTTGEISFNEAPVITSDSTYNLTVSAAANSESTSVNVLVTVINDTSNDTDEDPVITIPDNIIVAATDSFGTAKNVASISDFLAAASATDTEDGVINVTDNAADILPIGDTLITFSATDSFGNSVTAQATVTIADQAAPVITLIGDNLVTLNSGDIYTEQGAMALDNVDGNVSVVIGGDTVNTSTPGSYTLTYNVTDTAGNIASQVTRTVTVQDASAPVVSVPASIIVAATDNLGTANTQVSISTFLTAASANDSVDGNVSVTHDAPNVFPLGITTVTFTAVDSNNNAGTAQSTVTIADQMAPVITLTGDNSITLNSGDSYTEQGATAVDNVDGDISANLVVGGESVDTSTPGSYTLTYNVTDTAGNIASQVTRTINVQDASAPVVSAPANIIVAATDSSGTVNTQASINAFLTAASANDSVDGNVNVTHDAPNIFPLGVTTVTFTAVDSNNNTGTAQATVTIADQTAPVITLTGDNSITLNSGDSYTEQGATAVDNVDGDISASLVVGGGSVDTSTPGSYTLTYNVTDTAGNIASQVTRTVTVQDASAPVVSVPASIIVAATDSSGTVNTQASISTFLTAASANDSVDGNVNVTHDAPNIFPLGVTTVTFTAVDSNNNTSTAQAIVTITDQAAPVITLTGGNSITLNSGDSYIEQGAIAFDNVDGDISANLIVAGESVDTSTPGSYTLTYNVTDTAGNIASQVTRTINVQDASAPVVSAPASIIVAATDNLGTANTQASISAFLTAASANDSVDGNVSVTHDAPNVFPLGVTTVTFTAVDSNNNTGTAQATVTITDQAAPVITLVGDNAITVNLNGDYIEAGYSAVDNIDGDVSESVIVGGDSLDTTTAGNYTRTYNVTDAAGNIASQVTRQITVQDISAPVVSAPDNITVAAIDSAGTAISDTSIGAFLAQASANDAVDGIVSVTHDAPNVFPLGVTTVTFTAVDSNNNEGSSQATVTISDQAGPVIILVGDSAITVNLNDDYIDAGYSAVDNVDGDVSANIVVVGADILDTNTAGSYSLTYNVTDAAGNIASQVTRQITVQDISAPVVSAPDNITVAATDNFGTAISDSIIGEFLNRASAIDTVDGNVSVTHNAPNVFPLGVTTVTFTAMDNNDNAGSSQATVTVTDQTAPAITLTGNNAVTLNTGDLYNEQGATALDNVDGDVSAHVIVAGDILDTTTAGNYTLTYNVTDLAGNQAAQLSREILVLLDTDRDGTPNETDTDDDGDQFSDIDELGAGTDPLSAESLPLDNDGDFISDFTDTDDDNDDVLDIHDAFPFDASETLDSDKDGTGDKTDAYPFDASETKDSDGDGFGDNIDPNPTDANDLTAPTFADAIDAIELNASGLLTNVESAILAANIVANDMFDGEVATVIATDDLILSSGRQIILLSATDAAGNIAMKEIAVHINPQVELGSQLTAEAGSQLQVPVKLSGPAANYPVLLDYSITANSVVITGQLTIEQDAIAAELTLDIDALAQTGDQLEIHFTSATNAIIDDSTKVMVVIDNDNHAPIVSINVSQAGESVSVIAPSQGAVTLSATISDLNIADEHSISFEVLGGEFSDDAIDELANTFVFDPSQLESGKYQVKVTVTETNSNELLSTEIIILLAVNSELEVIVADSDHDGIADINDTDSDTSRLPVAEGEQPLQVSPGLSLALGDLAQGGVSASITTEVVDNDVHYDEISTITNFNISGLNLSGDSVAVVVPLAHGVIIPADAVYRKYTESKGWFNFVEDENNNLSSAAKDSEGNCPAPLSAEYLLEDLVTANGLVEGNDCIQLTIEDGGANDGDETVNGTVVDPGVLVVEQANIAPEVTVSDVTVKSGEEVSLTALATDAEGDELSFSWVQQTGTSVSISEPNSATLSFTAPEVTVDTQFTFEVSVNDGRETTTEVVQVTITAPVKSQHAGSFGWLLSFAGLLGLVRRKYTK